MQNYLLTIYDLFVIIIIEKERGKQSQEKNKKKLKKVLTSNKQCAIIKVQKERK